MDYIIYLLAGITAAALILTFFVLLPATIVFNVKAGKAYRDKLAGKIEKLRLGRMLSALGIDIDAYISKEHGTVIHTNLTQCMDCKNTDQCDEQIEHGNITIDTIGFCNNEKSLQSTQRKIN